MNFYEVSETVFTWTRSTLVRSLHSAQNCARLKFRFKVEKNFLSAYVGSWKCEMQEVNVRVEKRVHVGERLWK